MADWVRCDVLKAGPAEDGRVFVNVRYRNPHGEDTIERWYLAKEPHRREALATALAAMTSALRVDLLLEDLNEYTEISRIYLIA